MDERKEKWLQVRKEKVEGNVENENKKDLRERDVKKLEDVMDKKKIKMNEKRKLNMEEEEEGIEEKRMRKDEVKEKKN